MGDKDNRPTGKTADPFSMTMVVHKQQSQLELRQIKVFTNWANYKLAQRQLAIRSVVDDLKDGLILLNIAELCTQKTIPPSSYNRNPKIPMQKLNNTTVAINHLKEENKIKINVAPSAIVNGDVKEILSLFWFLIREYQLKGSYKTRMANTTDINSQLDLLEEQMAKGDAPEEDDGSAKRAGAIKDKIDEFNKWAADTERSLNNGRQDGENQIRANEKNLADVLRKWETENKQAENELKEKLAAIQNLIKEEERQPKAGNFDADKQRLRESEEKVKQAIEARKKAIKAEQDKAADRERRKKEVVTKIKALEGWVEVESKKPQEDMNDAEALKRVNRRIKDKIDLDAKQIKDLIMDLENEGARDWAKGERDHMDDVINGALTFLENLQKKFDLDQLARKRAAEEEEKNRRKKREAEEAAKKKAEEEERRRKEEAARKKAEEEERRRKEEADKKKKAEEDAARKKAADEAEKKRKADEEAARKKAAEDAEKRRAAEDAEKKRNREKELQNVIEDWNQRASAYEEWVEDKKKEAPHMTAPLIQKAQDDNDKRLAQLEQIWDQKIASAQAEINKLGLAPPSRLSSEVSSTSKSKSRPASSKGGSSGDADKFRPNLDRVAVKGLHDDLNGDLQKRQKQLGGGDEDDGRTFKLQTVSKEMDGVKCNICRKPLHMGTKIALIDNKDYYHYDCFVCEVCGKHFEEYYWSHKNKILCQEHFIESKGLKCAGCGKGITGKIVKAVDKQKWHPECLKCNTCGVGLMGKGSDELFSHQGRPYCKKDYYRAQGLLCERCEKPIGNGDKSALGKVWHKGCWFCSKCQKPFGPDGFVNVKGFPWCPKCADD
eukprot:TRINITY_DN133_c0_g1_i1.p1 TRINITY_DN133_c0_g1~~TRINITY_DN133_c0_g1_i1.p1  ORF type:complete len:836 (-),score=319.99 TRINITY_DN133_c0_g1_i1:69-2576(-)